MILILKHVVNSHKTCAEVKRRVDIKKNSAENNNPTTESTVTSYQIPSVKKTRKSISFTSRLIFAAHDLNRTEISFLLSKDHFDSL
jgi:hypothetical protein